MMIYDKFSIWMHIAYRDNVDKYHLMKIEIKTQLPPLDFHYFDQYTCRIQVRTHRPAPDEPFLFHSASLCI